MPKKKKGFVDKFLSAMNWLIAIDRELDRLGWNLLDYSEPKHRRKKRR